MASTTALKIIRKAMQKIGVLTKTETPDADEGNDALDTLNDLIASWSNDSLMVSARTWEAFPLTAGQHLYTIGAGANFNTQRPNQILDAHVRFGTTDSPVRVISDEIYTNSIYVKNSPGLPEFLNFDNAFPTANIRIWPVPTTVYNLFMLTEKSLATIPTLNATINLPDGWNRALIYNLAIELAPEYGEKVTDEIATIAKVARASIARAASKAHTMDAQPAVGAYSRNILSDS